MKQRIVLSWLEMPAFALITLALTAVLAIGLLNFNKITLGKLW